MSRHFNTATKRSVWAENMLEITPYVFVYGTLKRGYGNNHILIRAEFIGSDTTSEGWVLGDVGCPYAFPPSVVPEKFRKLLKPIKGEVYKIKETETAMSLDYLEGYDENMDHAHYYRRVIIPTKLGGPCWIYTSERFGRAHSCNTCNITDEGEWEWSRN